MQMLSDVQADDFVKSRLEELERDLEALLEITKEKYPIGGFHFNLLDECQTMLYILTDCTDIEQVKKLRVAVQSLLQKADFIVPVSYLGIDRSLSILLMKAVWNKICDSKTWLFDKL